MQDLKMKDMYYNAYMRAKCFKGLFTHDISNLFQVISNSLELCGMLLKEGIRKEEILEYFELIEEQINRGKRLVRNIRNISELEETEMPLEPIELFENLNKAVQYVQLNFLKRDVNVNISSKTEKIYVLANELLIDVFENIMINSILYNKNRTVQIEVSISESGEFSRQLIKLEFKDNGIGIDDSKKKEILQDSPNKSENSKGMGLGLSLVAKLINLCHGTIWIEDRVRGNSSKGSNFVILIPKATQIGLENSNYQEESKEVKKNKEKVNFN
jgi:signal transduction histidine kinase